MQNLNLSVYTKFSKDSEKSMWIKKNRELLSILLLLLLAFVCRVLFLGEQSLWLDESVIYIQTKQKSVWDVYRSVMEYEGHIGPVYHMLNYFFTKLFGFSEWAMRFPSALYGTITVYLTYIITVTLFSKRTALYATLIMAVSPLHIWYSQEARMFSLWSMFILLTVYLFIKIIQSDKFEIKLWLLMTLFVALSIWTFLNSIFIFFAMGVYLLINVKRDHKTLIYFTLSMIIAGCSYFPALYSLITRDITEVATDIGGIRKSSIFDFVYAFYVYNVGTTFGPPLIKIRALLSLGSVAAIKTILREHGGLILISMSGYGTLFVYALSKIFKKYQEKEHRFLLMVLFIPLIVVFAITYLSTLVPFNIRYILALLPFYIILLGYGIDKLSNSKRILVVGFCLIISTISLYNYHFNPAYAKIDFRSVVCNLKEIANPNDKMIIVHESAGPIFEYYDSGKEFEPYVMNQDHQYERYKKIIDSSTDRLIYFKSIVIQQYDRDLLHKLEKEISEKFIEVERETKHRYCEIIVYKKRKI